MSENSSLRNPLGDINLHINSAQGCIVQDSITQDIQPRDVKGSIWSLSERGTATKKCCPEEKINQMSMAERIGDYP